MQFVCLFLIWVQSQTSLSIFSLASFFFLIFSPFSLPHSPFSNPFMYLLYNVLTAVVLNNELK